MKRYLLPVLLFVSILTGCKKEDLTPDGKPKADAANNTLRIDLNSTLAYDYIVEVDNSDYSVMDRVSRNNQAMAYEYVATVQPGQKIGVSIHSLAGSKLTYDIYYKGAKVRLSAMNINLRDNIPDLSSELILSYVAGK